MAEQDTVSAFVMTYQPRMHLLVARIADVMQDSLLRSLLKGVVWRVFSTALTVSIILAVFRDTVQVRKKMANAWAALHSCLQHAPAKQSPGNPPFVSNQNCKPLGCTHMQSLAFCWLCKLCRMHCVVMVQSVVFRVWRQPLVSAELRAGRASATDWWAGVCSQAVCVFCS